MEDFESCLSEVLLKLNETGIAFPLEKEQESAMRHLFNGKDVIAWIWQEFNFSVVCQCKLG